jgi:hypothetical protein
MFASIGGFLYGANTLTYRPVHLLDDFELCNDLLPSEDLPPLDAKIDCPSLKTMKHFYTQQLYPGMPLAFKCDIPGVVPPVIAGKTYYIDHISHLYFRIIDDAGQVLKFPSPIVKTEDLQRSLAMDEFVPSDSFIVGKQLDEYFSMHVDDCDPHLIRSSFAYRLCTGMPVVFKSGIDASASDPPPVHRGGYRIGRVTDECFSVTFNGTDMNFSKSRSYCASRSITLADLFASIGNDDAWTVSPAAIEVLIEGAIVQVPGLNAAGAAAPPPSRPPLASCYIVTKLFKETNEIRISSSLNGPPIPPTNSVHEILLIDTQSYCKPLGRKWHGGVLDVCAFAHVFRRNIQFRSVQLGASNVKVLIDGSVPVPHVILQRAFDKFSILEVQEAVETVKLRRVIALSQFQHMQFLSSFTERHYSRPDYLHVFASYIRNGGKKSLTSVDDFEFDPLPLSPQEWCFAASGLLSVINSTSSKPTWMPICEAIYNHRKEEARSLVRNRILRAARARFFDASFSKPPSFQVTHVDERSKALRISGGDPSWSAIKRGKRVTLTGMPGKGPFVCSFSNSLLFGISEKKNDALQFVDVATDMRFQHDVIPHIPLWGDEMKRSKWSDGSFRMLPKTKRAVCLAASMPLLRIIGLRILNGCEYWEIDSCRCIRVGMKVRFYGWTLPRKNGEWNPCAKFYVKEIKYADVNLGIEYDCFSISDTQIAGKPFLVTPFAAAIARSPGGTSPGEILQLKIDAHKAAVARLEDVIAVPVTLKPHPEYSGVGFSTALSEVEKSKVLEKKTNRFIVFPATPEPVSPSLLPGELNIRFGISLVNSNQTSVRMHSPIHCPDDGMEAFLIPIPVPAFVNRVKGLFDPEFTVLGRDHYRLQFSFSSTSAPPFLIGQIVLMKGFTGDYGCAYLNGSRFKIAECSNNRLSIYINQKGTLDPGHTTNSKIIFQGADDLLAASYLAQEHHFELKREQLRVETELVPVRTVKDAVSTASFRSAFIENLARGLSIEPAFKAALENELGSITYASTPGLSEAYAKALQAAAVITSDQNFVPKSDQFTTACNCLVAEASKSYKQLSDACAAAVALSEAAQLKYQQLKDDAGIQIQLSEEYSTAGCNFLQEVKEAIQCHTRRFNRRLEDISVETLQSIVDTDNVKDTTVKLQGSFDYVMHGIYVIPRSLPPFVLGFHPLFQIAVLSALQPSFSGHTNSLSAAYKVPSYSKFQDVMGTFLNALREDAKIVLDEMKNSPQTIDFSSLVLSAAVTSDAARAYATPIAYVPGMDHQFFRTVALSRAFAAGIHLANGKSEAEVINHTSSWKKVCERVYDAARYLSCFHNSNHNIVHGFVSPLAISADLDNSRLFPVAFDGIFFSAFKSSVAAACCSGFISNVHDGKKKTFSKEEVDYFLDFISNTEDGSKQVGHIVAEFCFVGCIFFEIEFEIRTNEDSPEKFIIKRNNKKMFIDALGSLKNLIDFTEVCIFEEADVDEKCFSSAVDWIPVTQMSSTFTVPKDRTTSFSGQKIGCFRASVPCYGINVKLPVFSEIEFELNDNPGLSSWDVFASQRHAGYLIWSPNQVKQPIQSIDRCVWQSGVLPFEQQSGNLWSKTFDVQSLAASCYALLSTGQAPFCPAATAVEANAAAEAKTAAEAAEKAKYSQSVNTIMQNMQLSPYRKEVS